MATTDPENSGKIPSKDVASPYSPFSRKSREAEECFLDEDHGEKDDMGIFGDNISDDHWFPSPISMGKKSQLYNQMAMFSIVQ